MGKGDAQKKKAPDRASDGSAYKAPENEQKGLINRRTTRVALPKLQPHGANLAQKLYPLWRSLGHAFGRILMTNMRLSDTSNEF